MNVILEKTLGHQSSQLDNQEKYNIRSRVDVRSFIRRNKTCVIYLLPYNQTKCVFLPGQPSKG